MIMTDNIDSVYEEYENRLTRTASDFDFTDTLDRYEVIMNLLDCATDEMSDLKDCFFDILNHITDNPDRITLDKDITIRDGEVYKYNENTRARMKDVANNYNLILDNVDCEEHRQNLKEIFEELKIISRYFSVIKFLDGYKKDKWRHEDNVWRYVGETEDNFYYYYDRNIYVADRKFHVGEYSYTDAFRLYKYNSNPITMERIKKFDYNIEVDDINNLLDKIIVELEFMIEYIRFVYNKIGEIFSSYLVSKKI